jgi:hypothetical protein
MSARAFLRGGLNAPDGGARNALARRCCRHLTELRHSLSGLAPRSRRPHRIRLGVRRVSVTLADALPRSRSVRLLGVPWDNGSLTGAPLRVGISIYRVT